MYQKDSIPSHLVYSVMTASLQDSNNVQNQTHIICHLTLPQTGDKNNVLIYALIGLIALSGLGLTIKKQ
jgi:LPXTG-motif cell wall-anchored protein